MIVFTACVRCVKDVPETEQVSVIIQVEQLNCNGITETEMDLESEDFGGYLVDMIKDEDSSRITYDWDYDDVKLHFCSDCDVMTVCPSDTYMCGGCGETEYK